MSVTRSGAVTSGHPGDTAGKGMSTVRIHSVNPVCGSPRRGSIVLTCTDLFRNA